MPLIIGVDIGGTFTDAVLIDLPTGEVSSAKVRTTNDDLVQGVVQALDLLAAQIGSSTGAVLKDAVKFVHGTTQTSNVMYTWAGSKTGLLTTRGFADELLIMRARGRVAGLGLNERRHFRTTNKPPQIVPRELIEEVAERVDHRGQILVPLNTQEAQRAVDALLAKGVESIAISLLWSPAMPDHELLLERIIKASAPSLHVSVSHRIAPVVGEYERTATTAVNAYVGPTVANYLGRLAKQLGEIGLERPLLILQASGGAAESAETLPVNTIESGPAAGMVAAELLAASAGYRNVIATDVGGTTFKVGLIVDGDSTLARETIINQYVVLVPAIDLVSIGAGGGSIAWADDTRLRVGPQSAGAEPGPVAYGWGGIRPTVTDADLILGLLTPGRFLGGRIQLRADLAEKAVREQIADPLFDGDVVRAAAGIRKVADSQMADLVRKMTIERGHDPRDFVLMAYGGAGPLHAVDYARQVGVRTVVIPPVATVYSAYGAAVSDIHHSLQRSLLSSFPDDLEDVVAAFRALEEEGRRLLERQAVAPHEMLMLRWADMRYERQLHDVRVSISTQREEADLVDLVRGAFNERYQALYGSQSTLVGVGLQIVRVGVEAVGSTPKPPSQVFEAGDANPTGANLDSRKIYWSDAGQWLESTVWEGLQLKPGNRLSGPAVVDLPGTTIALPPGVTAQVSTDMSVIIDLGPEN